MLIVEWLSCSEKDRRIIDVVITSSYVCRRCQVITDRTAFHFQPGRCRSKNSSGKFWRAFSVTGGVSSFAITIIAIAIKVHNGRPSYPRRIFAKVRPNNRIPCGIQYKNNETSKRFDCPIGFLMRSQKRCDAEYYRTCDAKYPVQELIGHIFSKHWTLVQSEYWDESKSSCRDCDIPLGNEEALRIHPESDRDWFHCKGMRGFELGYRFKASGFKVDPAFSSEKQWACIYDLVVSIWNEWMDRKKAGWDCVESQLQVSASYSDSDAGVIRDVRRELRRRYFEHP
ncbi:hypothetical protein QBC38DRAFT_491094 [Podospora fimiseda]|uniref:Uncharacterized protein n=1 Tax=Podospora fimiseda TaxID=252190 RepID=A0AAN7BDN7_9PEZI|nr:hypothetical protein QBC38DRAFT_491094 [Podospora fimiseda]